MYLFVNVTKITSVILQHFEDNSVNVIIQNYDDILETFEKTVNETLGKIWISKDSSYSLTSKVPRLKRIQDTSPVQLMKAVKNKIEAEGFINSHVRDGIALVKYFSWLENEVKNKKTVTELSGAAKLEEFRRYYLPFIVSNNQDFCISSKLSLFMGLSFYTINASGPHSSMPHYSPTKESDRNITDTEMYLCDSGGQYL
jgi:Xaa-Pro aminopeptidase